MEAAPIGFEDIECGGEVIVVGVDDATRKEPQSGIKLFALASAYDQPVSEECHPARNLIDLIPGYKGRYSKAAAYLILLLLGWSLTRATCSADLPSDCNLTGGLTSMSNLQVMFTYGVVQAWMCNILDKERFWYIFSWQRWYFFAAFFATGPIFSYVTDLPVLQTSLSSGKTYTTEQIVIFSVVGALIMAFMLWHFCYAWVLFSSLNYRRNFWVYALSRLVTVAYFAVYTVLAVKESSDGFHFHHYFFGWSLSLFASFSHPVSLIWLAVMAGIFVQGIGAYDSQFLFYQQ